MGENKKEMYDKRYYRDAIMEIVNGIQEIDYLEKIYHYSKVKYDIEREKAGD